MNPSPVNGRPPKWSQRPLTRGDWIVLIGFLSLLLAISAAILAYAIWQGPAELATGEITTDTAPAVQIGQYPPLAVLPAFGFPADNKYSIEKAELGKMLFFDPRLSGDGSLSCNSCHPASDGSWSVATPISIGYPGTTHWRNASGLINATFYSKLNWDGGKPGLEVQAEGAWSGAVAGNVDLAMAEERLAQVPEYVERFEAVFGTQYPLISDAFKAVATFERTIVSQNVPFDAFLEGADGAISDLAKQGFDLFRGRANCLACHNGPLISDDSYHNTGVPDPPEFASNPLTQITFRFEHWAKGVSEADYNSATSDLGLFYVTKLDSDIGKFRTPALRDVCYSPPYMHNGVFGTLAEVVAFYNQGGGDHPNKDPLLEPLNLSAGEQAGLVAFLESLCGDKIIVRAPPLPPYAPWPAP